MKLLTGLLAAASMASLATTSPDNQSVLLMTGDGKTTTIGPAHLWNPNDPAFVGFEIVKESVVVQAGPHAMYDNGVDGELNSDYGQGFIDYPTGHYYIVFNEAPAKSVPVTMNFKVAKPPPSAVN